MDGEKLAKFIEDMADCLVLTTITVSDEVNAYTIFETLNARGVQLSTPDLVKNYIFSIIDKDRLHDSAVKGLEDQWSKVIHQLGDSKFSSFIRMDWNSKNDFSRAGDLFKKIKQKINTPEKAREYLNDLKTNSQFYAAFQDYNDEFWRTHSNGQYNKERLKLSLRTLNLFKIVTPQSLLLSAFSQLSPDDFIKLLYYIEVISIRYNVICSKLPSEQEKVYSKAAKNMYESSAPSINKALDGLRQIYPSDEEFLHAFKLKTFKTRQTNKKACWILYRIEKHLKQSKDTDVDFEDITVEHILPQNPAQEWGQSFNNKEVMEDYIERVGNLTLLSAKDNKKIAGDDFKTKKKCFEESDIEITKQCSRYNKWNEDSIERHQAWLGKKAVELWRSPPLK